MTAKFFEHKIKDNKKKTKKSKKVAQSSYTQGLINEGAAIIKFEKDLKFWNSIPTFIRDTYPKPVLEDYLKKIKT
jgi:hypothetical protein